MATPVNLTGYKMTFDAEMSSAADMSQFQSTFDNGWRALYSNGEAQAYADYNDPAAPNPYSVSGGALNITASPTPYYGQPYVSGMVSTDHHFAQAYGYFEARIDTPGDTGFWPAFWMLPDGGAGLPEIDIMEQPNNNGANSYWNYVSAITTKSGGFVDGGTDLSQGYHTYGLLWTPSTIQFSLDGNLIGSPITTPPALIDQKMYMLLNLAVGNSSSWPGAPVSGASATMSVDYIRAYSNDPTANAISPQAVSMPGGSSPAATLSPADQTIGSGPNSFVIKVSEDAYQGDAQFTISVDGTQYGGVLTTTASHAAGQSQNVIINGNFDPTMKHTAQINFLNDAYGGAGAGLDRNLYVDAASFDGTPSAPNNGSLFSNGSISFLSAATAGQDKLTVALAEDAYKGDAQATISLDGEFLGGVTVTAPNTGSPQTFDFLGSFGSGPHTVGVSFINDTNDASGDRNLYVKGATFDGVSHPDATASLFWNQQVNLNI